MQIVNGARCALCASTVLFVAGQTLAQPAFTDQSLSSRVGTTHSRASWPAPPGPMIAGGAVGDFNNDGWPDIYLLRGDAGPNRLLINQQDGTFENEAAAWGVADQHMGSGVSVGDFNNDGWSDMYVTSYGPGDGTTYGPGDHRLYRNNGDGTFTNVAVSAGVNSTGPLASGTGSTFGDYDCDGDLDLYVAGHLLGSNGSRLFRNNGDETFTDVTAAAGVEDAGIRGFSPRFADMDGDGLQDLLVAADFGSSRYFINNGDGTFTDFTGPSGTGLDSHGMGAAIGDVNNDGLLDWYVTSIWYSQSTPQFSGNMLYINQGNHIYTESAAAWDCIDGGWGWGTDAVDFDLDTYLDLVNTNGWPAQDWEFDKTRFFRNLGATMTEEMAVTCGIDQDGQGRGLVTLDYDRDGDRDIVVFENNGFVTLFRNDTDQTGLHSLTLSFDTSQDPRLAPHGKGTRVIATFGGGQSLHRYMDGGATYLGQSEMTVHFGLSIWSMVGELRIEWANGIVTTLNDVPANQMLTIVAPKLGDINQDGFIGSDDLASLIGTWGQDSPAADLVKDGVVDSQDLAELIGRWGL